MCHMCFHLCFNIHIWRAKSSIQYMTQIVCHPSAYILYPDLESAAHCQILISQNKWNITQELMWDAITRGAWWPTGANFGKEAEHSLAQPECFGSAPDLCSAPYAGQQFSAAPIPATAPDRQWATGAACRFIKPQPKHTEPHPFPLPMKTTHTGTGQAHALITSFTLIIFYSHLASYNFYWSVMLPLRVLCYFIEWLMYGEIAMCLVNISSLLKYESSHKYIFFPLLYGST